MLQLQCFGTMDLNEQKFIAGGLGMKVSNKESMVTWCLQQIENGLYLTDFIPFLTHLVTINDIKAFLRTKIKQIGENKSKNTNSTNVRSIFIKVAPIYDILPHDVIVNIIKYVPTTQHHYQCMHFLPTLCKTFKSIMYENVSVFYNKYKMTTNDDGMPMTLSHETLRLHLYHRKQCDKIQFVPRLGISVFNDKNANHNSDDRSNNESMNDLTTVAPVLSGLNEYWDTFEMYETINDDSSAGSDNSYTNLGTKSKKIALLVKKSDIDTDKIDFPWHLIKHWEIKCKKNGTMWKHDTKILQNIDVNNEMEIINLLKKSSKCLNIISVQHKREPKSKAKMIASTKFEQNNEEKESKKDSVETKTAHFGKFARAGSSKLIFVLNKAAPHIRCLTLNHFPCTNYDVRNRLTNDYPQFDRLFYLCLGNIACDFHVSYGICNVILKEKIKVINLEILELCNITHGDDCKYTEKKSFKRCWKRLKKAIIKDTSTRDSIETKQDRDVGKFINDNSDNKNDKIENESESEDKMIDNFRKTGKEPMPRFGRSRRYSFSSDEEEDWELDYFLKSFAQDWMLLRSRLLLVQKIMNILNDIGKNSGTNHGGGLNLKI